MSPVVLDTHVLVWLLFGTTDLGAETRRLARQALADDSLWVSAISFWEVALLNRRDRLTVGQAPEAWRRSVLRSGVVEIPVAGEIGIVAAELDDFHRDPADRIIAATTVVHGATLITADSRILEWPGTLGRHDART